jgi:hypothetical protein
MLQALKSCLALPHTVYLTLTTTMFADFRLLSLPPELIENILLHLHPLEIVQCRQVRRIDGTNFQPRLWVSTCALFHKYRKLPDLQQVKADDR